MPRIDGTTNRQSAFLRAFRLCQDGPPPEARPSPAILRRWLRHDGFRRAFVDMQRTLKAALSFQSLTTGLAAAQSLHASLRAGGPDAGANLPTTETENQNSQILDPPDPATARAKLQRERLQNRTALTFLRLAHARLTKPPRRRTPPHQPTAAATADDASPSTGRGPWRLLPGETRPPPQAPQLPPRGRHRLVQGRTPPRLRRS